MEVKLGDKVKDKVTGFTGIAYAKTEYLNGCVQMDIKPRVDKDGRPQDGMCIDIEQLEKVGTKSVLVKKAGTGGAMKVSRSMSRR